MSTGKARAALLIDADNLSPEGMERALAELQRRGLDVSVRRAYGSHETLATVKDFLLAHTVRAVVNQGKGTTDAALIVDVMDLHYGDGLPGVIAIGSGDADFTPLVVRLREAGKQVLCFAQRRKAAGGLDRAYDEVIHVDAAARARTPEREAPPPALSRAPAAAAKTGARSGARKAAPAKAARVVEVSERDRILSVLETIPGLAQGEDVAMNVVVKRLRDEKLMSRNASVRTLIEKHGLPVELLPQKQPNKLRWLG